MMQIQLMSESYAFDFQLPLYMSASYLVDSLKIMIIFDSRCAGTGFDRGAGGYRYVV